jgi:hypothetical protein
MMAKTDRVWMDRCAQRVWGGTFSGHPCGNKAKYTEGGKRWCHVHLPSAVKNRRKTQNAKWDRDFQIEQKRWAIRKAESDVANRCVAIDGESVEALPQSVAKLVSKLITLREELADLKGE